MAALSQLNRRDLRKGMIKLCPEYMIRDINQMKP